MFTPHKLGIVGLTLCAAMARVNFPGLAARVSAASAAPTVAVSAQVSTVYLSVPGPDETFRTVAMHHLTLHLTGSGFTPGSKVRIAVMRTAPWKLLAKGSTYAEFAIRQCSWTIRDCSEPNPRAGTIDYRVRLTSAPPASDLVVLYRSTGRTGMHDLSLAQQ